MSQAKPNIIAHNPNAYRNYTIVETVEAGLVLTGTEIKSLREKGILLKDGWVEVDIRQGRFLATLCSVHIAPYGHGNIWNHDPLRKRPLLLHRRQITKLHVALTQKGMSVVPIDVHFEKRRAKVLLGLGKGKKDYDKRQDIKNRDSNKELAQLKKKNLRNSQE
jgi:SsrA-binding protein